MEHDDELELVRRAEAGDEYALNTLFEKHRGRLLRMVSLRMNRALAGRVDASDVVQDSYLEAARVLNRYLENPSLPFFLWLRHLAGEKLIQAHRQHLGAQKRSVSKEVAIHQRLPEASSDSIADFLAASATSPSRAAIKNENKQQLERALEQMQPLDREVLVMRHFEHLSGPETATALSISHDAVKKRYVRALEKLSKLLEA